MKVFGLTGGVASGKGTVAQRFRQLGVPVVDADELAREVVAAGTPGYREIVEHFGEEVVGRDGELNRRVLAQAVFGDQSRLQALNAIVHPRVQEELQKRLTDLEAQGHTLVCYEVPLLFENGLEDRFRPVVLVAASVDNQVERAMKRSGWSEAEARARIAAQMPLANKRQLADFVIENDASIEAAQERAGEVLARIRRAPPE